MQLRRAGLDVIDLPDADGSARVSPAVCVVDAVGADAPDPRMWGQVVEALRADPDVVLLAVVSGQLPPWLAEFAERALRVGAPISGHALAERIGAELASEDLPLDLGLTSERIIDLVDDLDQEAAAASVQDRPTPAPHSPALTARGAGSVPLGLANLDELAGALLATLPAVPTLHDLAGQAAERLAGALEADVAVMVRDLDACSWAVVAGVGLRPLEWRPQSGDPPLLDLLDARRPILLVRSSDDVRQAAAGLPCASREHLLVGRCTGLDVAVTVGRDEPPMTAADVRALGRELDDTGLGDALLLRALAVRLQAYAEL
jgi:hypothetical protein